jgi:hypothetical protein
MRAGAQGQVDAFYSQLYHLRDLRPHPVEAA